MDFDHKHCMPCVFSFCPSKIFPPGGDEPRELWSVGLRFAHMFEERFTVPWDWGVQEDW